MESVRTSDLVSSSSVQTTDPFWVKDQVSPGRKTTLECTTFPIPSKDPRQNIPVIEISSPETGY